MRIHLRRLWSPGSSRPRSPSPRGNLGPGSWGGVEEKRGLLDRGRGGGDFLKGETSAAVAACPFIRGRAGSAAVPPNRVPGAALRSVSPGKESEPGWRAGPGAGEGVVQPGAGRSQSCRQQVHRAEKTVEPGNGRSHGAVGGARRCGPRGPCLQLWERRRGGRGGRGELGSGACVCSGRGPPQRGSAG